MKAEAVERRLAELEREREAEERIEQNAQLWQKWLDQQIIAEVEGGGLEHEPPALLAESLAALGGAVEDELNALDDKVRRENGELRRALIEQTISFVSERRKRTLEASALRKKVAVLEARIEHERSEREGLAKAVASLDQTIARDRAHRRLLDSRRSYPHRSRVELEKARRRTDALIDDRMSEGGFADA